MTRSSIPRLRVPRAPFSRPNTPATGRPERPDPCTDPPTLTIDPTRVMPLRPDGTVVGGPGSDDGSAAAVTVPRLRSVTPAGGGALGDGRVLAVASALGALGGLACWVLAARTLPPDELGRAVAVVALVAVAACAARPDRGAALVHRLPAAGRRAGRVVVRSLAAAVALGAGAGALLALLVPGPAATLSGPFAAPGARWWGVLLVAAAAAAWAVGGVHDGVVVALDRPGWAVAHVGMVVTTRGALLAAAAFTLGAGLTADGLATAWLAPVVLFALPGSAAVAVLARRHARRGEAEPPPGTSRTRVARRGAPAGVLAPAPLLGPTALARFGATLLHHVPPLAVVVGLGPTPGMLFFVAWQAVTAADLAAVWVLGRPSGASRRRLLVTVGPGLAAAALLAGPLLAVFGPAYAEAADVLRVLLLGAVFRLVVVHELGAREAAGRAWSSARLHLFTTVPTLLAVAGAVTLVALTGEPAAGPGVVLRPVVVAYAAVQVACAAAVLVFRPARRRARPEGGS